MRAMRQAAVLGILLATSQPLRVGATPGGAPDLYVHPTLGSDSAPGTSSEPVRSPAAAVRLLPEVLMSSVTIHVAEGAYTATGIDDMPRGTLVLHRRMRPGVEVAFVGRDGSFRRPAAVGAVVFNWQGEPLVRMSEGRWRFERLQIGDGSARQRSGIEARDTGIARLKDIRIRTRSFSGAGIHAARGGRVELLGSIELNEHLHDTALDESFSGILATHYGSVAFRDDEGRLSVGNGQLSAAYYGIIELGCASAEITSWGEQSNVIAVNNSGRVDLHGTTTTLRAQREGNAVIGLEDDGHVLAEGARVIIRAPDLNGAVVLQKASTFFGGPIEIHGKPCRVSAMSGSVLLGSVKGDLEWASADTGAHVFLECQGSVREVREDCCGRVVVKTLGP
ncbi:MAG: hypothetical protein JSV65_18675 [Armatimonadota bacterium]|nr:MAG: hypothetical protein JSV65_18675 [Armatimonadota bacterium]